MVMLNQGTLVAVKSDPSLAKNLNPNYDPNFERDP